MAEAMLDSQPIDDMPDRMQMLNKAFARAQEMEAEEKLMRAKRRRGSILRVAVVVGVALVILVTSTMIAVFMPPSNAQADSWFDRFVTTLRYAFRIESTPGQTQLAEDTNMNIHEFASIAEMREAGYHQPYPSSLPEGYNISEITIKDSDSLFVVHYIFSNMSSNILVAYEEGAIGTRDLVYDEEDIYIPFAEGAYSGVMMQYADGYISISCIHKDLGRRISLSGTLDEDAARMIIQDIADGE